MNVTELSQELMAEFPGCPMATLQDQLRWAQRALCTDGNAWIVDDGPAVVGANTPFAEVDVPDGAEALRLMSLRDASGRELVAGREYRQNAANAVTFERVPEGLSVSGSVACRPAPGRDMPDELIGRWAEVLKVGARYRLYLLPQPWRDPAMAEFNRATFTSACSDARQQARIGFQTGAARVRVPRFF
ncbi:hypothetical protein ACT048_20695 [Ectopseudomonas khazarica]|uniref:hypothetical protein n=1 Tax=Ectopseudomonas khazarica TaxID=2502979 RepID=UPI0040346DFD